jgi:DNA-binding transcriptional MerR regulator
MDEEKLISKKEVLKKMGISYGQLYRWKRKGLIPESWFIRRSTFTGQETFFPQEKILERIERIKAMKEDHPLDDLADLITEQVNEKLEVAFSKLRKMGWLDEQVIQVCHLREDGQSVLSLNETFCIGVLRQMRGTARKEEIDLTKRTLDEALAKGLIERIREERLSLHLLRKRLSAVGISAEISLVTIANEGAFFDPDIEVVQSIELRTLLERIKLDLAKEKEHSTKGEQKRREKAQEQAEEDR